MRPPWLALMGSWDFGKDLEFDSMRIEGGVAVFCELFANLRFSQRVAGPHCARCCVRDLGAHSLCGAEHHALPVLQAELFSLPICFVECARPSVYPGTLLLLQLRVSHAACATEVNAKHMNFFVCNTQTCATN
jgi:hypothetical protein